MIIAYLATFCFSFLISLCLTKGFIWLSYKFDFLDVPMQLSRKNHQKSTPLLGGPAVFISFFMTIFFLTIIFYFFEEQIVSLLNIEYLSFTNIFSQAKKLFSIFMGGFLILVVGIKDDKHGMNPLPKLLAVTLVAFLLFYLNIRITIFIKLPYISFIFTLLWMLFLTNSFNLLDNMDGSSSLVAVSASLSMLIVSVILEQYLVSLYLITFIGVLLGFLRYNFFGGRIFLGDSGALFIGYNLSVATILESFFISGKSSAMLVFLPLFIFIVPLYDTFSVILIRIKNGHPVYKGDLNHVTHRLERKGLSKKVTVLFVSGLSLIIGAASSYLFLRYSMSFINAIALFAIAFSLVFLFEKITGWILSQKVFKE